VVGDELQAPKADDFSLNEFDASQVVAFGNEGEFG
jgi:hypothetical protein